MANAETTNLAEETASFLTNLYGLKVTAKEDSEVTDFSFGALGTYVNDDDEVKGKILCDLQGAAILGAALTQIPMGRVDDAVKSGSLPENLQDNLSEVFNISVNLLPGHHTHRLVLRETIFEAGSTDVDSIKSEGVGVVLEVQRYGQCVLYLC